MENTDNGFAGVKEIASTLGCSEKTVRRYHAWSVLPTFQIAGKHSAIKISRSDLRNLI